MQSIVFEWLYIKGRERRWNKNKMSKTMKNLQDISFLTISKIYSKKSKTTIPTATIEIESSQVLFPSSSLSILNFHREKKRATSPYFPFSTPKKPFLVSLLDIIQSTSSKFYFASVHQSIEKTFDNRFIVWEKYHFLGPFTRWLND